MIRDGLGNPVEVGDKLAMARAIVEKALAELVLVDVKEIVVLNQPRPLVMVTLSFPLPVANDGRIPIALKVSDPEQRPKLVH